MPGLFWVSGRVERVASNIVPQTEANRTPLFTVDRPDVTGRFCRDLFPVPGCADPAGDGVQPRALSVLAPWTHSVPLPTQRHQASPRKLSDSPEQVVMVSLDKAAGLRVKH
jgi:hypothetical protein